MFNKFLFTNMTHRFIVHTEHRIKLIKLKFTQFFYEIFSTFYILEFEILYYRGMIIILIKILTSIVFNIYER